MDSMCVCNHQSYCTNIHAQRHWPCPLFRAVAAELDQPFAVQVGGSQRTQLALEHLQGRGFGPSWRFTHFLHVINVHVDEMAEGLRPSRPLPRRLAPTINLAFSFVRPFARMITA